MSGCSWSLFQYQNLLGTVELKYSLKLERLISCYQLPFFGRCVPLLPSVAYIKPNAAELLAMAEDVRGRRNRGGFPAALPSTHSPLHSSGVGSQRGESIQASLGNGQQYQAAIPNSLTALLSDTATVLLEGVGHIVLTLGAHGAALLSCHHLGPEGTVGINPRGGGGDGSSSGIVEVHVSYMRALPAEVVNLSGAGERVGQ